MEVDGVGLLKSESLGLIITPDGTGETAVRDGGEIVLPLRWELVSVMLALKVDRDMGRVQLWQIIEFIIQCRAQPDMSVHWSTFLNL